MATDQDFATAVQFVLDHEGGYVHDPNDPGGETKYGITKRSYPYLDIPSLTVDDARGIYYRDYWFPSGADRLPMPLALVQLDTAVNTGVSRAGDFLNQSGGDVATYLQLRADYYQQLAASDPRFATFLRGWLNRLAALRVAAAGIPVVGPLLDVAIDPVTGDPTPLGLGVLALLALGGAIAVARA